MFGKQRTDTKINYKLLAKAMHELALEQEYALTEETKTPVGVIEDKEELEQYKKITQEEVGLEVLIKDLLRIKADIQYRKSAWWDNAFRHIGADRSARYQVVLSTGEIFQVTHGYEDILRRMQTEEALDKESDFGDIKP